MWLVDPTITSLIIIIIIISINRKWSWIRVDVICCPKTLLYAGTTLLLEIYNDLYNRISNLLYNIINKLEIINYSCVLDSVELGTVFLCAAYYIKCHEYFKYCENNNLSRWFILLKRINLSGLAINPVHVV